MLRELKDISAVKNPYRVQALEMESKLEMLRISFQKVRNTLVLLW